MARKQEIGYALADGVLVAAAAAHEFALDHLRLEEEAMQVLERLAVGAQLLGRRGRGRQGREAKLGS